MELVPLAFSSPLFQQALPQCLQIILALSESETRGLEFSNFKAVAGRYCCFLEDTTEVFGFFKSAKDLGLLG